MQYEADIRLQICKSNIFGSLTSESMRCVLIAWGANEFQIKFSKFCFNRCVSLQHTQIKENSTENIVPLFSHMFRFIGFIYTGRCVLTIFNETFLTSTAGFQWFLICSHKTEYLAHEIHWIYLSAQTTDLFWASMTIRFFLRRPFLFVTIGHIHGKYIQSKCVWGFVLLKDFLCF